MSSSNDPGTTATCSIGSTRAVGSPASTSTDRGADRGTASTLRAGAFWSAVVLPVVAVAILWTGLDSVGSWTLFVSVLLANAVALYVGHPHCMDR